MQTVEYENFVSKMAPILVRPQYAVIHFVRNNSNCLGYILTLARICNSRHVLPDKTLNLTWNDIALNETVHLIESAVALKPLST